MTRRGGLLGHLVAPVPDPGTEVLGTGTVIDDGAATRLCLGSVLDCLPPEGSGPRLLGWDWDRTPPGDQCDGVRWGDYAVVGTWDGATLTQTRPPVALPLHTPPPRRSGARPPRRPRGRLSTKKLLALQAELHSSRTLGVETSYVDAGTLWMTVVYDDGTVQSALDAAYGLGAVAVGSLLQPVTGDPFEPTAVGGP